MNSTLLTTVVRRTMQSALRRTSRVSTRRIMSMSQSRAMQRPLYKGIYTPMISALGLRHHGHKVAPSKYSIVARHAHGLKDYMFAWEHLVFTESEWRWCTFWIWAPSLFATFIMFYVIWNSAWRDPEVRLRPHKKGWHFNDNRTANGVPYRFGAFIWVPWNRKRIEYFRKIGEEGFEDREPGQIGWDEMPIPKLDDEDE